VLAVKPPCSTLKSPSRAVSPRLASAQRTPGAHPRRWLRHPLNDASLLEVGLDFARFFTIKGGLPTLLSEKRGPPTLSSSLA
jgi:hypothetical protein